MLKPLCAGLCVLAMTGCASFVNEATHPIRVDTLADQGQAVSGADCRLTNDHGSTLSRSGETTQVRRSSKDLDITCKHPDHPDAVGRAISRGNAGLAGNIVFGGGIGAIIDLNKGTAYSYPTWVRLVFGRTLVFDSAAQTDGKPVDGADPMAKP